MSLTDWIVLAVIVEDPRHGFSVARELAPDAPIGQVWTVRRPLVYRAIENLAGDGMLEASRTEPGTQGPHRTVYRATRTGQGPAHPLARRTGRPSARRARRVAREVRAPRSTRRRAHTARAPPARAVRAGDRRVDAPRRVAWPGPTGSSPAGGWSRRARSPAPSRPSWPTRPAGSSTAPPYHRRMVPTPTTDLAIDDIDFGQGEFWDRSEVDKEGAFALLRRERPVSWHSEPPLENTDIEVGPGFWAVVRYADVMHVSRNPQLFISGRGSNIPDWPPEVLEFLGSMINMDDPRHTKLRLIVNRGFTPHQIGELTQAVEDRARAIVDDGRRPRRVRLRPRHRVAAAARHHLRHARDPERGPRVHLRADEPRARRRRSRGRTDARHRVHGRAPAVGLRADPRPGASRPPARRHHDEAHAGRGRGPPPHGRRVRLVLRAPHRRGQRDHPQRDQPRDARPHAATPTSAWRGKPTSRASRRRAVEEIVRWASPVIHFRRSATADTEIAGQPIAEGDKVGALVQLGEPRRGRVRRPVPLRRAARRPTSTSASVPAVRTSASARTWPGSRSR